MGMRDWKHKIVWLVLTQESVILIFLYGFHMIIKVFKIYINFVIFISIFLYILTPCDEYFIDYNTNWS